MHIHHQSIQYEDSKVVFPEHLKFALAKQIHYWLMYNQQLTVQCIENLLV